ncbi:FAD dependent oxidoreductase [delta proteobacterium NaphS2]|nr:FAD dependent oxidoreductase [delta proteobacterium NaphS2]
MGKILETEVLIIGGGIIGASVARELQKYKIDVALVEKSPNLCSATSKGSHSMIYWGAEMAFSLVLKSIMAPPGTELYDPEFPFLKLAKKGFDLTDNLFHELDIIHSHPSIIIIARDKEELEMLRKLEEISNDLTDKMGGGKVQMIDKKALNEMEPNVTGHAIAALLDESNLIEVFAPDYVFALVENAKDNGCKVSMNTEVKKISRKNGVYTVETNRGTIETEFIINAGGKYADYVADMAGARDDWGLAFNKTQMMVLDKRLKGLVNSVIMGAPGPGVFDFLLPLHTGNLYVGCGTYEPVEDRDDAATVRENFDYAIEHARALVPAVSEKDVITSFYGTRYWNTRDPESHIIEVSKGAPNFINLVIKLPGFSPAPAIARSVVNLLSDQGLQLTEKSYFNPIRKRIPRFGMLSNEEKKELIAQDSRYGNIICFCETVTEGEIIEAIKRGATTIQAVKYMTRAGMGRCQRNFCGPRVVEILARELNMPVNEIVYEKPASKDILF